MKRQKRKILEDHKKIGKQLVPQLVASFNLQDISYINKILPETIWLALFNAAYGNAPGAEISLEIVKEASNVSNGELSFSFISSFESLTQDQQHRLKEVLTRKGLLIPIHNTLGNFITVYPKCPLHFLFDSKVETSRDTSQIKDLLIKLYDKRGSETTFMLANVIYHLFALDRLKVTPETSLARLPELIDYPKTDISKRIASNIRATMYSIMQSPFFNAQGQWNYYFWNRGFELEPFKM